MLLALVEQGLISQCDIEGKVCPILLERSAADCDDEWQSRGHECKSSWEWLANLVANVGLEFSQELDFGQHHSLSEVARAHSRQFH